MSDPGRDPVTFTWRTVFYALVGGEINFWSSSACSKNRMGGPTLVLGLIAIALIFSQEFRVRFLDVLRRSLIPLALTAAFVLIVATCSLV
jgi:hypothetical protein